MLPYKKPYEPECSVRIGDHNDTCNMTVGQFIPEKEAKCQKKYFSTLFVWNTVGVSRCMLIAELYSHCRDIHNFKMSCVTDSLAYRLHHNNIAWYRLSMHASQFSCIFR